MAVAAKSSSKAKGRAAGETVAAGLPDFPARELPHTALAKLAEELVRRDYQVVGPTVRDDAIVLGPIVSGADLASRLGAETDSGWYRLQPVPEAMLPGAGPPANSAKNYLHPAEVRLFGAARENNGLRVVDEELPEPKYAFLGLRPCDLAAIQRQDEVLNKAPFPDAMYARRRQGAVLVVLQCTQPAPTCFCASMGTGPRAAAGFDIALTEIPGSQDQRLLGEAGSPLGIELLKLLEGVPADSHTLEQTRSALELAAGQMERRVETDGLRDLLYAEFDNPHWDDIATHCLTCGNCTMVCPTCFCTTVDDASGLDGQTAERFRRWDSCFTQGFSYIHGGSVRLSAKARYRQWLTHKFAAWQDQFGKPGCVGCGRCITWCPARIDITTEIAALRRTAAGNGQQASQPGSVRA